MAWALEQLDVSPERAPRPRDDRIGIRTLLVRFIALVAPFLVSLGTSEPVHAATCSDPFGSTYVCPEVQLDAPSDGSTVTQPLTLYVTPITDTFSSAYLNVDVTARICTDSADCAGTTVWQQTFDCESSTFCKENGIQTSQLVSSTLANGVYYWQAQADDALFSTGPWSPLFSFTVGAGGSTLVADGTAWDDPTSTTPWAECDGVTPNVTVAVDSTVVGSTTCDPTTGVWAMPGVSASAGSVIVAYLDPAAGSDAGAVYDHVEAAGTDVSGLDLHVGVTRVTASSVSYDTMSALELATWDRTDDPALDLSVSGTGAITSTDPDHQLRVDSAAILMPSDTITVGRLVLVGGSSLDSSGDDITLTGWHGSGACSGAGPPVLCVDATSSWASVGELVQVTGDVVGPAELRVDAPVTLGTLEVTPTSPTAQAIVIAGDLTATSLLVGDSATSTLVAAAANADLRVDGLLGIRAAARIDLDESTATLELRGDATGAGTLEQTAGTTTIAPATDGRSIGSTSGSSDWTFHDLVVRNPTASPRTARTAAGGTGTIRIGGDLQVSAAGDTAPTTFDANTNDRTIDVDGSIDVLSNGALAASSANQLVVGGDLVVAGSFAANGGELVMDGAGVHDLDWSAPVSLGSLTFATADLQARFDETHRTTLTGSLSADGGSCSTPVVLGSMAPGDAFELDVGGSSSVTNARIADSTAITALTASDSIDDGGNTGWTITEGACGSTTTVGVDSATVALGAVLPGADVVGTIGIDVTTDAADGYTASVTDTSDTAATDCSCADDIADWTGTDAAPSTWTAGTAGYAGISVFDATGGRMAKWGTGTGTDPDDHAANRYAGIRLGSPTVLHVTSAPAAGDRIEAGWRLNVDAGTTPGSRSASITIAVVANP